MYKFDRENFGEFVVHRSNQVRGDVHRKRFLLGVTPQNQATLNVYVSGQFRLTCGAFEQTMSGGDTSLDVALGVYPHGLTVQEQVTSDTGTRLCIAVPGGGKWFRQKTPVTDAEAFPGDSLVVVLYGHVNGHAPGGVFMLRAGQTIAGSATVVRCWR